MGYGLKAIDSDTEYRLLSGIQNGGSYRETDWRLLSGIRIKDY